MGLEEYENRYLTPGTWDPSESIVKVRAMDDSVFEVSELMVPSATDDASDCLDDDDKNVPYHKLRLLDKTHIQGQFGTLRIRARRFDFKSPSKIRALVFCTGSRRKFQADIPHDGLILCPNYNFIGEHCSEIGPSIAVFNSSGGKMEYPDLSSSPVAVLFERTDSEFLPMTLLELDNNKLAVPPKGKKKLHIGSWNGHLRPKPLNRGGIFYPSIGACDLPEGVFFDDIMHEDNTINVYNISSSEKDIVIKEEEGVEGVVDYFLGYLNVLKGRMLDMEYMDNITLNTNTEALNKTFLITTQGPVVSVMPLKTASITLTPFRIANISPISEERDKFNIYRYLKVFSVIRGLVVLSQFIPIDYNSVTDTLPKITVFNVTNKPLKANYPFLVNLSEAIKLKL